MEISSSNSSHYFWSSFIVSLGAMYNIYAEDSIVSGVFILMSAVLLSIGLVKGFASTKDKTE